MKRIATPTLEIPSRKGFLIALGAASLAACSSGATQLPGVRKTQIFCNPNTQQCTPPGGGGGGTIPYSSTGGVNPDAFPDFYQYVDVGSTISSGYSTTGTTAQHGGNNSAGTLVSHASHSWSSGSSGTTINSSVIPYGYSSTTYSATGIMPSELPTNGSYEMFGFTVTNTPSTYGTQVQIQLTVQGAPCSITMYPTDSTDQHFQLDYKNDSSGYVASYTITLPGTATASSTRRTESAGRACHGIGTLGFAATIFGLALGAALLPEAAAVGAAYAALGTIAGGATWIGSATTVIGGLAGCI